MRVFGATSLALSLLLYVVPTSSVADEFVLRSGYKFNEYPQDRLRFIPTVESTPVVPDETREEQHAFYTELEYRFSKSLGDFLTLEGLFFAQAHVGRINPVGLQTDDMPISALSFSDNYYFGATFPEVYLRGEAENFTLDFGFINPVYGNSSIPIADVFAKSRQFVGMRKSEDASTELRQGNLGLRLNTFVGDGELTLIYMPDIPELHKFSNFGDRAYLRYDRDTASGSYGVFALHQTRDNYDGPYTAILDVFCAECTDFNVPAIRETENTSVGVQFDAGISDSLTNYGEALLSSKTSKFIVTQTGPITGVNQKADANAVSYRRHSNGPYLKFMLGAQYSFTTTDLVRFEFIHDQNGYSKAEKDAWLGLLDQSLRLRSDQLYGDLRDFNHNFGTFSQNYVFWNYERRMGRKVDNVLSVGQYVSIDDGSFLTFGGYSHAISDRISLNVRGTFSTGRRFSDFGSLGERSSLSIFAEITC